VDSSRLFLLATAATLCLSIFSRSANAQDPHDTNNVPAPTASTPAIARLERDLTRSLIAAPAGQPAQTSKDDDLARIIARIRSVTFDKPEPLNDPPQLTMDILAEEPNDTNAVEPSPEQQPTFPLPQPLDYKPVSEQTLAEFARFQQDPNLIPNPFELAEILYNSNRFAEAARCYRKALEFAAAGNAKAGEDRAWIIFQLANATARSNPEAARALYAQLITEHPTAEWTELARAKLALIDWLALEKPYELITREENHQPEHGL
jgi:tetratricopeptide (TPR) repeat protein